MTVMSAPLRENANVVEQKLAPADASDDMKVDSEMNGVVDGKAKVANTETRVNGHVDLPNGQPARLNSRESQMMRSVALENVDAPTSPKPRPAVVDSNSHLPSPPPAATTASAIALPATKLPKIDTPPADSRDAAEPCQTASAASTSSSTSASSASSASSAGVAGEAAHSKVRESNSLPHVKGHSVGSNSTAGTAVPQSPRRARTAPAIKTEQIHAADARPGVKMEPDEEMTDAPPSPGRTLTRPREDEDLVDDRVVKRSRTDERGSSVPEFKVPDLPTQTSSSVGTPQQSGSPQPSSETGQKLTIDASKPISDYQYKELFKIFSTIKRLKGALPFLYPVDTKLYTAYPLVVKHPIDLQTMERTLKNNKYHTLQALVNDVDLMMNNAISFNGLAHPVTKQGIDLRNRLYAKINGLPPANAVEPPPPPKKGKRASIPRAPSQRRESRPVSSAKSPTVASQTYALDPQGIPLIRRDSAVEGRPKRTIHPPPSRDMPYMNVKPKRKKFQLELRFCQDALDELNKKRHDVYSYAFKEPVDPVALGIPTYFSVVKKPMDLRTIGEKLRSNQYENAKEFHEDVKLMFNNCYKFNGPHNPVSLQGQELEAVFDAKWQEKKHWIAERMPREQAPRHDSSDEEEEVEEEEYDEEEVENNDEVGEIQRQLAELAKKLERAQKKQSPPIQGKKARKASRKDSKKTSTSTKKERRPAKTHQEKKVPYVSYEQKQDISNRINSLPEHRMGQALDIIRKSMPKLEGLNDDEIELDIDELSNEVLLKLWNFVRKYAPKPEDSPPPAPERPSVASTTQSRPKKHKPMGKHQQEAAIKQLQDRIASFQHASDGSPDPVVGDGHHQGSDSSGDDASDESEEE